MLNLDFGTENSGLYSGHKGPNGPDSDGSIYEARLSLFAVSMSELAAANAARRASVLARPPFAAAPAALAATECSIELRNEAAQEPRRDIASRLTVDLGLRSSKCARI